MSTPSTQAAIDDYIAAAPPHTQGLLRDLRAAIRAVAPDAVETISYGMPAYAQNGRLVYFAALKDGIGFYPTASGIAAFQAEVSGYAGTKGAMRFPLDGCVTFRSTNLPRAQGPPRIVTIVE
jgi:uncharacterized protein YdhG (YjbR/CyaY superfamily)